MTEEEVLQQYDLSLDGSTLVKKGYASLLAVPNDWSLWMGDSTAYGETYVGPILWVDAEVELKWGVLKWLINKSSIAFKASSLGGKLIGVLNAQRYLGVRIYKSRSLDNLYWFAFGFEPQAAPQVSGFGFAVTTTLLVGVAAVLLAGALGLFGVGYVIRTIRMRPQDLAQAPQKKEGLGDTLKQAQYLLIIGVGAWLVTKFVK